MSETLEFWLLIALLALGTWAMRAMPIMLHGKVPSPAWLERLLKHVPVAALTALVVPGALYLKINGAYELAPARTISAAVAMLVALKTKNVLLTLIVGMSALWLAQYALAAIPG